MKKAILLFILIYSTGFGHGEISFQKQKEKVEQERLEKLKIQTDDNVNENAEQNSLQKEVKEMFYDDKYEKRVNKASRISKNIGNRKLIEYIKTQNSRISENEIRRILRAVFTYSKQYNINPYLVLAIMNTESHFKHSTVSSAGALGLMQLMPLNFKEFRVNNSVEGNIKGGVMHLKRDFNRTGDLVKTLVCYNAGCGRLANNAWKGIKETREYIPKVIQKYNKIINL